jgi:hypothetical protein
VETARFEAANDRGRPFAIGRQEPVRPPTPDEPSRPVPADRERQLFGTRFLGGFGLVEFTRP